jgi:hypothetical protein
LFRRRRDPRSVEKIVVDGGRLARTPRRFEVVVIYAAARTATFGGETAVEDLEVLDRRRTSEVEEVLAGTAVSGAGALSPAR